MDDFERRWQRIHDQLLFQMGGEEPRPLSSTRTLFGIRSEVEKKMDRFAQEIEDEYRAQRNAERAESAERGERTSEKLVREEPSPQATRPEAPANKPSPHDLDA